MKQVFVVLTSNGTVSVSMGVPDGYTGPYEVSEDFEINQHLYRLIDGRLQIDPEMEAAQRREEAVAAAQNQRDAALQQCAMARVMRGALPESLRVAWDEYESALGSIEGQPGYPDNIQWPTAPGA